MWHSQQTPKNLLPLEKQEILASRYEGKLLLRTEILLDQKLFQTLLSLKYFIQIPSIIKQNTLLTCQRCNNKQQSLFALLPCHTCELEHVYCRKCIEMGRVIECEPLYFWQGKMLSWPKYDKACVWSGELSVNQALAAAEIVTTIEEERKRLLVWGVCGSGKTEMIFSGIEKALSMGKRICIATPRADVVRELLPRLRTAFPSVPIQALYGGSKEREGTAQLIIATTHQLLRYKDAFDVLVIDENDAFPFHADPSLPFAAQRAKREHGTLIYLTATPRAIQRKEIKRNKLPHVFVPTRFHGHPLPVPRTKMCFTLQKLLQSTRPPMKLLKEIINRPHKDRQLLIFLPTIHLTEKLQQVLAKELVRAKVIKKTELLQAVHAEDPDREKKVQQFREKEIFVLLTTTILERGVTFPSIDVHVLDAGHTVFDEAALVQIAGRAGRSPKDPNGDVVFYHDGKTHAMVQAIKLIKAMNRRGGFNK